MWQRCGIVLPLACQVGAAAPGVGVGGRDQAALFVSVHKVVLMAAPCPHPLPARLQWTAWR